MTVPRLVIDVLVPFNALVPLLAPFRPCLHETRRLILTLDSDLVLLIFVRRDVIVIVEDVDSVKVCKMLSVKQDLCREQRFPRAVWAERRLIS
jgi:hypothetical protein